MQHKSIDFVFRLVFI